ncbi:MAG TPA: putative zinc-binding protein [Methanoregulaceae archaeon]|nr:putative zinc-binding protein [Methanoregulaceae archaeon]
MEQQNSSCNCGSEGKKRIIYSCSGIGSNVGQLSNAAACRLTTEGFGGGSCLAAVGGNVDKLIEMGKKADERIIIDGCPVACAKKIMNGQALPIDRYVLITDLGIEKTPGPAYNEHDLETVLKAVKKIGKIS